MPIHIQQQHRGTVLWRLCTCTCTRGCMCTYICICIHVSICMCTCRYTCTCAYTRQGTPFTTHVQVLSRKGDPRLPQEIRSMRPIWKGRRPKRRPPLPTHHTPPSKGPTLVTTQARDDLRCRCAPSAARGRRGFFAVGCQQCVLCEYIRAPTLHSPIVRTAECPCQAQSPKPSIAKPCRKILSNLA